MTKKEFFATDGFGAAAVLILASIGETVTQFPASRNLTSHNTVLTGTSLRVYS
jgi:hypothetical protein